MAETLSPFVYWGQNKDRVYLKVDLKEITNHQVDLEEDHLNFTAQGIGLRGRNDYHFEVEFYLEIQPKESFFRVTDRYVEFQLKKVGIGETWPRLTVEQKKPPWLKIDFDHFCFADDSEPDEDDLMMSEEDMMRKLEQDMRSAESTAKVDFLMVYMVMYNMFQWIGFCYIMLRLSFEYMRYGDESKTRAFEVVGDQVAICQLAALMEIVHPLFGWVRSSALQSAIQVLGRNLILLGLIAAEPLLQQQPVVWWLFVAWSAIEIIRYPYYILNEVHKEVKLITWLRYTVWIPLYPLGFILEGIVMMLSLPMFERSGKWSIEMPNSLNIAFHFTIFLKIYMFAYFPGMYLLMKRMYEQRKKKLQIKPAVKKGTKVKKS